VITNDATIEDLRMKVAQLWDGALKRNR
jgi:hypothetical protein